MEGPAGCPGGENLFRQSPPLISSGQYFTSARICDALTERSSLPEGPRSSWLWPETRWLEQNSMGSSGPSFQTWRADQFGRFSFTTPASREASAWRCTENHGGGRCGGRGSANFGNRSMRLDTNATSCRIRWGGAHFPEDGCDRLLGSTEFAERVRDAIRRKAPGPGDRGCARGIERSPRWKSAWSLSPVFAWMGSATLSTLSPR
jgi:hypothetical protein